MRPIAIPNREEFFAQVWDLVRQVPPGRVATYGQIASLLPPPTGLDYATFAAHRARWVGAAMAACPDDVPWHRVINAQGRSSLDTEGSQRQRELLEAEGVIFDERERVDLRRFGWNPSEDRPPEQPALW
ncbi:MAG TPA: methyltransferase [Chloroflexi bacterium]|nr:methyltransferase [Chloroflexota bacterium]